MTVQALAPAKLNLGLEVIRRREDGYHDIRTVMTAIAIFDRLSVVRADCPAFTTDDPALTSDDNLAVRAARLIEQRRPGTASRIHLTKRIPAGSGLGGASSDAAATLLATRAEHILTITDDALLAMGAELGSDVPFFVRGGTALIEGRGDRITLLPPIRRLWCVVVAPRLAIPAKTATLYRALRASDFTDGSRVDPNPVSWLDADLGNAFERPLYDLAPSLRTVPELMRRCGARTVGLSGAGPAHYSLEDDPVQAQRVARNLRECLGDRANVFTAPLLDRGVLLAESGTVTEPSGWA